tara:strand:- start:7233 stop:7871 length:639 start_codon:yes stop_codon:yes gene_type:complete
MDSRISNIRKDYNKNQIDFLNVNSNPIDFFKIWIEDALKINQEDSISFTLSTATHNVPSSRVVLLRKISEYGLVFFTNYDSCKGNEIFQNNNVSANFYWSELERQIRINGNVEKISNRESEIYFHSRPRSSQLAATISNQSSVISLDSDFDQKLEELDLKYKGKEIPKPDNWGGYLIVPYYIEFWQGRPSRLHDRLVYNKKDTKWEITRLSP